MGGSVLGQGMKGLSAPKIEGKLALRASITGSIYMDEVRLDSILGRLLIYLGK